MSQSGGNDAGSKGVPPPVPTFAAKPPVPSFNEGPGGGKRLALTFGGAALDADEASDKVCTKEDAGRGSDAKGFGSTPTCSGVCKHLHLVQGPVPGRGQSLVGLGAPSRSGGVLVLACVGGRVSFHGACNATMSPWGPWLRSLDRLGGMLRTTQGVGNQFADTVVDGGMLQNRKIVEAGQQHRSREHM